MAYPIFLVPMKISGSKTRIMAMFWPPLVSFLCQILLRLCVSAETQGNTNTGDICPPSLELQCFPYADNNGELGCGYCHFNCTRQPPVTNCRYSKIFVSLQTDRKGLSILSTSQEKINVVRHLTHCNSSFDFDDLKLLGINFDNLQNNTLYICDEETTLPDFEFYPCGSSRKMYRYKKDDDVNISTKAPAPAPSTPHGCSIIQFPEPLQQGILLHYHLPEECARCIEESRECQWQDGINSSSNFTCTKGEISNQTSTPKRNLHHLGLIAGLVITGCTIIVLTLYAAWRLYKYKFIPRPKRLDSTKSDLEDGGVYCGFPMIFNYTELTEATGNFHSSRVLGDGGFGIVYHGKLRDGREVAVKRLYERNYNQVQQFKNEVEILTGLRHPNLVVLYGCTSRHSRELLLIYEYIPNGTVADHLHGELASSRLLTWPLRMKIAIETASALSYLHASDIIHRDVKTNNVLLDNNFCVKVADFGLSRLFPTDVSHISTAPQGTPGYLDPEYHKCYQLTEKSDVYSFGVVLLELISSLAAVDIFRPADEINLSDYALPKIENHAFHELIDPELGFESDVRVRRMTIQVAELAFLCLQQKKEFRPSMNVVLETLENIDNADYEDAETEEMSTKEKSQHEGLFLSPPEDHDEAGLLKNIESLSPNSVMEHFASRSTM